MKTLKITLKMAAVVFAILFFNGCDKEEILPDELNAAEEQVADLDPETERMAAYLVSDYGFARKDITATATDLIAEGDIAFPKENFWELYGQPEGSFKHYRHTNLISDRVVNVRFASNVPDAWKVAYRDAMNKWTLAGEFGGEAVQFRECAECPVQLTVSYVNLNLIGVLNSMTPAATQFPTSTGLPGATSKINSAYTGTLSSSHKLWVAVHELGHAIGMRHTDSGEGTLIQTSNSACNTGTDPNSVMRHPVIGKFSSFTPCDIAAYRQIYPFILPL